MKVFVDADSCPVKEIIVNVAKHNDIPVFMFIDTSHQYNDGYSTTITVDKGSDSVDLAIINRIEAKDICITQDYGLAGMIIAKGAYAIHQNGFEYNNSNIDRMLFERHIGKELRRAGKRGSKINKRTKEDNIKFEQFFSLFIQKVIHA